MSGDLSIEDVYVGSYGADSAAAYSAAAYSAAAYLRISNGGGEDRLVSVTSPDAASVAPMGSMAADGSSSESGTDLLPTPIPAGGGVTFEPGGAHLMLEGMVTPAEPGATVVLRLVFEHAPPVEVTAQVVDVADIPDLMERS